MTSVCGLFGKKHLILEIYEASSTKYLATIVVAEVSKAFV